jgi:hypothetical protein
VLSVDQYASTIEIGKIRTTLRKEPMPYIWRELKTKHFTFDNS